MHSRTRLFGLLLIFSFLHVCGLRAQQLEDSYISYDFETFIDMPLDNDNAVSEMVNPHSQFVDSLLQYASLYIGSRYRSGSKGPSAFDCSGFTGYVFKHFGITLGASSSDQFLRGLEIKQRDILPGDLVFFGGRNDKKRFRVGHVGIVTDVDSENHRFRFIHASTSQGVVIDEFPDRYYYVHRLKGFRRMFVE